MLSARTVSLTRVWWPDSQKLTAAPRGERLVARSAPRRLEQRIDEKDRVLDGSGRVVGDERGFERGLQLVRDERREILERLVAPGKLERRSRQALFGRPPPDDRCQ